MKLHTLTPANRISSNLLKTSCILLVLSIIAITYGARLQANSQQFDMYQQYVMNNMAEMHPGDQLAPNFGIGLILASAWPFVGAVQGAIFMVFAAGVMLFRIIRTHYHNRWPYIIFSLLIIGFCLFSAFRYLDVALDSFVWRFYVRGIGELFAAIGLTFGAIALLNGVEPRSLLSKLQWRVFKAKHTTNL